MENPNTNKIRELRETGLSYGSIAKMFDISRARIHQICSGYKSPASSYHIKRIHKAILVRDNFECQWDKNCKDKKIGIEDLVVHHIDFNDRNESSDNLIVLCRFCHAGFHSTNHIDKKILKNITDNHNRTNKVCPICKKEFWFRGNNRKTCSEECLKKLITVDPKISKEKHKICVKRYYDKIKHTLKFKNKNREYQKTHYLKNRNIILKKSKEYVSKNREKNREYQRNRYWKLKNS